MTLQEWLLLFPEVMWSLFIDDEETYEVYGWINLDFVLLKLGYTDDNTFDFCEIRTSSAGYREVFYDRVCQMVYHAESGGLPDLQLLMNREDLNGIPNIEREYVS